MYYTKVVDDVLNNQWKNGTTWWGLKEGMIDLKDFNTVVPEDVRKLVEERRQGVITGSAPIWKGPLKDNTGKEQIPAGQTADDNFLHGIKFYVEGVEGNIPG